MATSCSFCPIVAGEVVAHFVLDAPNVVAFLDHRPLFPGHLLLVPRAHHATLGDLPPDLVAPLFGAARLLAAAVEGALGAGGTFVAMNNRISQSVPHLHVHVIPRRKKDGLKGFFWPRHAYKNDEEIALTLAAIKRALG